MSSKYKKHVENEKKLSDHITYTKLIRNISRQVKLN